MILFISVASVVSLISAFIYLSVLFFLSLAKGSSFLLFFSKNQPLVVLFPHCLLCFVYLCSNLVSFFLLTLGLVCSFSGSLRYKVSLFIWDLTS